MKRAFAVLVLVYFSYLGFTRMRAIVHADACLDGGGSYDADSDTCKP